MVAGVTFADETFLFDLANIRLLAALVLFCQAFVSAGVALMAKGFYQLPASPLRFALLFIADSCGACTHLLDLLVHRDRQFCSFWKTFSVWDFLPHGARCLFNLWSRA